jgi:hypothetical protein
LFTTTKKNCSKGNFEHQNYLGTNFKYKIKSFLS